MQELDAKGDALAAAGAEVHVIGQLQRNKAAIAARWAQCVQTVDSLALAERLSRLALEAERDLDVMIQVNVSGEESKAGVAPGEALALAARVQALPGLTVTGWMTIGLNSREEGPVRAGYRRLREIRDQALIESERGAANLREAWELSMGMSGDLEWAIAEGASMVRVGTAVMGRRA
jgi:pyridoxal phosphate enzyme (YggS family)